MLLVPGFTYSQAVLLDVPLVEQEQNNWCWVGSTKCVMGLYGVNPVQCEIAEWARSENPGTFGTQNCCSNPTGKCNSFNSIWDETGGMPAILRHFANVYSDDLRRILSASEINNQINAGRPFIIRIADPGHFIVGRGWNNSNNTLYWMDPWYNEGYGFQVYNGSSLHGRTWTDTLYVTTNPGPAEPPVAAFTADAVNVPTGRNVNFTDQSSNSPTTWSWDFGDGGSSTEQNPSHAYGTPGIYTVELSATNSAGSDTELKSNYITVTQALPSVGNSQKLSTATNAANRRAVPYTMPETGTISSVTQYHDGGSGYMVLAVYEGEGSPTNRIGVTADTQVSGSSGWQTINLTSPVTVQSGKTIWLAWVYETNPNIYYDSGTPGRVDAGEGWAGGMPATYGSGTQADYIYSIYCSYSTAGTTQYTLTTNTVGGGSITKSPDGGTYDEGTQVTLTAVPDSGKRFSGWSGDLTGSTNPAVITMDADKSVTATFTTDSQQATVGFTQQFGQSTTTANRRSMPFTMPENGSITSISMYHTGGGGDMILAVYDGEGAPANRIAVTAATAVAANDGWQTINVTNPVCVEGGTTVWLTWVYETNPGILFQAGSPGRYDAGEGWSGGMPASFGSGSQADYEYSIYASYTPGCTPINNPKTLGNSEVFATATNNANRRAVPYTMPETGTISSISIYHDAGSGSMILGVYEGANAPANRIAVTTAATVAGSSGWQTVNLSSPVTVQAGETIWLAWVFENNPNVYYQTGTPGRYDAGTGWVGGMPSAFGTGATQADYIYSIYCTYTKE